MWLLTIELSLVLSNTDGTSFYGSLRKNKCGSADIRRSHKYAEIIATWSLVCQLQVPTHRFIVLPAFVQTFINHFNCRRISDTQEVLHKNHSIECWTGSWWWLTAVISGTGLALFSFGVPICLGLWMRSHWVEQMRLVRLESKPRAVAYRDFRRKFSSVAVRFVHRSEHAIVVVCQILRAALAGRV